VITRAQARKNRIYRLTAELLQIGMERAELGAMRPEEAVAIEDWHTLRIPLIRKALEMAK
jgi:hypothetical protein